VIVPVIGPVIGSKWLMYPKVISWIKNKTSSSSGFNQNSFKQEKQNLPSGVIKHGGPLGNL